MTKPLLVISCLAMKRQKFLHDLKAKRYNVNLVNKKSTKTKHLGSFIFDLMMKMKRKLP